MMNYVIWTDKVSFVDPPDPSDFRLYTGVFYTDGGKGYWLDWSPFAYHAKHYGDKKEVEDILRLLESEGILAYILPAGKE